MKIIGHNLKQAYMTYFEPKVIGIDKNGPSFSGTYIVTGDSLFSVPEMGMKKVPLKELSKACAKIIGDKLGKNTPKDKNWFLNKADGSTTRDAYIDDSGEYLDGFHKDAWILSGKKYPGDVNRSKCGQFDSGELYVINKAKKRITAQEGDLKAGDVVNVVFDVYAFDGKEAKGCTATIEGVQKWADGESLKLGVGSSGVTDDDFDSEDEFEDANGEASDLM